jgi:DNA invertase Pin-like site-specific DNA recombinase
LPPCSRNQFRACAQTVRPSDYEHPNLARFTRRLADVGNARGFVVEIAVAKSEPEAVTALVRAAEYVRASTDDQEYSTANQSDAIHAYATTRGMAIVRTYADEGKSGLRIERRDALKQLIDDVLTGEADFSVILVYDISRWGRFQDADESAYYEYICRRAGIKVHYCVEQFENDGNPFSAIVKSIKRAMAGEYSRELSAKVFTGQLRLVRLGFRQGGSAGYGLRRQLVDQTGTAKGTLAHHEWKSITTDRVVLTPGPPEEIEIVRWIFTSFAEQRKSLRAIARDLNRQGIKNVRGGAWQSHHVRKILQNENYIGNLVWNRQSVKLKGKVVNNSPDKWIRIEGALVPIVERALFDCAQAVFLERPPELTQEQKLAPLRRLLEKHGTLSMRLIKRSTGVPSPSSYNRWFGGLLKAYELVGFPERSHGRGGRARKSKPGITRRLSDRELLHLLEDLYRKHGYLTRNVIDAAEGIPSAGTYTRRFGSLEHAYELIGLPWGFPNRQPRKPRPPSVRRSKKELLDILRKILRKHGSLSRKIIDDEPGAPPTATYQYHFGGILPAYERIGYDLQRRRSRSLKDRTKSLSNTQLLDLLRKLRRRRGRLSARLIDETKGLPAVSTFHARFGNLSRAYQLIGYVPKRTAAKRQATAKG